MGGILRRRDVDKALLTETFSPSSLPSGMVKATEKLQKEDTVVPDVPRKFAPYLANVLHVVSHLFFPLTSLDLTTISSL